MTFRNATLRYLMAASLGLTAGSMAAAQSTEKDRKQSKDRTAESQSEQQDEYRSARPSVSATPEGWVSVAVDYDWDGRFDAVETIYVYDLEQAKQSSESRKRKTRDKRSADIRRQRESDQQRKSAQQRRSGTNDDRSKTASYRSQGEQRREMDRRDRQGGKSMQEKTAKKARLISFTGTVNSLRSDLMAGTSSPRRFARIQSQDGKTQIVCLGTDQQLGSMDVNRQDKLQIKGVKARLNDRPIVLATEVKRGDQTVQIDLPRRVRLKRVKATLKDHRTVKFRGFDDPFLVGQIETLGGKRALVNLGPKKKFQGVNLSDGTSMRLLVRPGKVGGQNAMIAQEVRVEGETIRLPRPKSKRRFRKGDGGRRDS